MMQDNAPKSGGGKNFRRLETINKGSLKDGNQVVRFLQDGDQILYANFHDFVETKDQPEAFTGKRWPKAMPAVCGYDKNYGHGACYVCDSKMEGKFGLLKPNSMTYILANRREPLLADKTSPLAGQVIGYQSAMMDVEVMENGEKVTKKFPELVIVQLPVRSIGAGLMAEWERRGTICGNDWTLTRTGEGVDTRYGIAADRADQEFFRLHGGTGEVMQNWSDFYNPVLEALKVDLVQSLKDMGSKEHYDRWYVPGAEVEWTAAKAKDEDVPEPEHTAGKVSEDARNALQARLQASLGN